MIPVNVSTTTSVSTQHYLRDSLRPIHQTLNPSARPQPHPRIVQQHRLKKGIMSTDFLGMRILSYVSRVPGFCFVVRR